ncbi:MAG: bifunctional chorismate mutase/prephenate dehydrogenase [Myxococcota bacterium]
MTSEHDEPLAQLRAQLDTVDHELMEIAARRMAIVRQIGALKASRGAPVFDRARERLVLQRARLLASQHALPEALGESMFQALIEASHDLQEETVESASPPSEHQQFLIVGGAGQMGQLLGSALMERGHTIDVLEAGDHNQVEARVRRADVVMIAVPMAVAETVAATLAPWVREDALICDINSLKSAICQVFQEQCSSEALGLHPMFGPTVHALRRQKTVVCPVRPGPRATWMTRELQRLGMEVIVATPDDHDRMMAIVQVLVHFNTLVMGDALRRTGISVAESLQFTSPIYRLELAFVGRLFTQDPGLYAEIEMRNPYSAQAREHYRDAVASLHGIIDSGDREAFRMAFEELTRYFSDFGEESMELSDFVIDTIVARS